MLRVDRNKHCSFNESVRKLFYMKQNINNSPTYTEEEKRSLTSKIEKDINNTWEQQKYELNKNKV